MNLRAVFIEQLLISCPFLLGLKVVNNWPTFPQLIVNGEFVGGLDIIKEMIANGEFEELVKSS